MQIKAKVFSIFGLVVLSACGGSGGGGGLGFEISSPASISAGECTKVTASISEAATKDYIAVIGLPEGVEGGVYRDAGCTELAFLNLEIRTGESSIDAYVMLEGSGEKSLPASLLSDGRQVANAEKSIRLE